MLDSGRLNHSPPDMLSDQPPFLTVQQASKLLHVSTWAVYQAIRSGELPVIRWGRRVVLQREDLAGLLASKRQEGVGSSTSRSRYGSATRRGLYGPATTELPRTITVDESEPT
jgi:excisionase family DNA binding protein